MKRNNQQFNIVLAGIGGQGLITLLQIISEAALSKGCDIRTSELHGLSQRGGSVEVHIRFGKKIYSPMVAMGKADLILGLEMQEALRGVCYADSATKILVNRYLVPISLSESPSEEKIFNALKKIGKNVYLIPAMEICREKFGNEVAAGIYLLGFAVFKKLIPLDSNSILKAIKKIIPEKYLELNLKAFNSAEN